MHTGIRGLLVLFLLLALGGTYAIAGCDAQPQFCNVDTPSNNPTTIRCICSPPPPASDFTSGGFFEVGGAAPVSFQPLGGVAFAAVTVPCDTVGTSTLKAFDNQGHAILLGQFVKTHTKKDGTLDLSNVNLKAPGTKNLNLSNVISLTENVTVTGCGSPLTLALADLQSLSGTIIVQSTPDANINTFEITAWTAVYASKTVCGTSSGSATLQLIPSDQIHSTGFIFLDTNTIVGTLHSSVKTQNLGGFVSVDRLDGTLDQSANTVHLVFDGDFEAGTVPSLTFWGTVSLIAVIAGMLIAFRRAKAHRPTEA